MPSTPFVNSSIRSTIPNPCEGIQQILIKVIYENVRKAVWVFSQLQASVIDLPGF